MSNATDTKKELTKNLGPVAKGCHQAAKVAAAQEGKSLRDFLEGIIGPRVGWKPEDKTQLKMEGLS